MMRNPLFLKLSLGLLGLLLVLGGLIVWVGAKTVEDYYDEANQKLNKELATWTQSHVTTFDDSLNVNTESIQDIMHSMMVINPDVEVYLLNEKGGLITYVAPKKKIVREKIDLAPIKEFIKTDGAVCIRGDDPRSATGKKIFSAAPVLKDGKTVAYYYIILASQERASTLAELGENYALGLGVKLLGFSLLLSLIFGAIFLWYATRSLVPIMGAMDQFSMGDYRSRINVPESDFSKLAHTYNHMASEIEGNIEKIKSVDDFRRELIANISHDIRTPLTVINGYAETLSLKGDQLSADQKSKYFEYINESTKRATGLLNQLIELSKLENSQLEVVKEAFSLDELVSDLTARYSFLLEEKNIKLKYERPEVLPLAFGDIGLIERVIQNLFENAIKYSPRETEITIELSTAIDGQIIFNISDQGQGIAKANISKIFDRYERVHKNKKDNKSMGLGLAIARKALELHNSSLQVTSKLNVGTTFSFGLRLA